MSLKTTSALLALTLLAPGAALAQGDACPGSDTLDLEIQGFGRHTVGGYQPGADVYCVTSLADDGPGTLREGTRTGGAPRIIRFAVDGEIRLNGGIGLPGNLTIDGRGHDIRIKEKGFRIWGVREVILINLAIEDVGPDSEDGIQINGNGTDTGNIVLDHLRFSQTTGMGASDYVDEAISVVFGAHDITIAHCRFDDWEKVMLLGNGDAPPEVDEKISVTIHHNVFNSTGRRHPRGRYGTFDVFNNEYFDWHMYDWVGPPIWHISHGAKCESGCRMYLEANNYERHWHPQDILSTANFALICEDRGNVFDRGGHWIAPENDVPLRFDPRCLPWTIARPYPVTVDAAGPALRAQLLEEAGNTLQ